MRRGNTAPIVAGAPYSSGIRGQRRCASPTAGAVWRSSTDGSVPRTMICQRHLPRSRGKKDGAGPMRSYGQAQPGDFLRELAVEPGLPLARHAPHRRLHSATRSAAERRIPVPAPKGDLPLIESRDSRAGWPPGWRDGAVCSLRYTFPPRMLRPARPATWVSSGKVARRGRKSGR